MRAAVRTAPRSIDLVNRSNPEARENEVAVRIRNVGICGGDLLYFLDQGPVHSTSTSFVVCHEAIGETPDGIRVVIDPLLSCQRCHACNDGQPQWCPDRRDMGYGADGVAAEIVAMTPERLHAVPTNVSDEVATLAHALAAVLHALKKVEVRPGQRALVLGPGPAGLLFGLRLKSLGVAVTIAGRQSPRLQIAEALDMEPVVSSDLDRLVGSKSSDSFDVVVETTGAESIQALTPSLLRSGGSLLLYAPGRFFLDINLVFRKEIQIFGSSGAPDTIPDALRLMSDGSVDVSPIISDIYPFEEINDAFERAVASPFERGAFVKALVRVEG